MDAEVVIKLERAGRVLDVSRAHPSDNPGQEAAVTRLEETVTRAKALVSEEETGHHLQHFSVLTKDDQRGTIGEMLRLLVGVAKAAAVEVPGVVARVKGRGGKLGNLAFLAQAKVALAQATELQELFTRFGMPAGFLEELGTLVAQFETSLSQKDAGSASHIGANADLIAAMAVIQQIVHQLDALNRLRFRNDAGLKAKWNNAKDVHWPHPQPEVAREKGGVGPSPS